MNPTCNPGIRLSLRAQLAALLLLASGLALGPTPAAVAATAEASPDAMIQRLSTEVLESIRSDKAIQAGDFDRVQKLVNERIMPNVDFDKMTRMAVGRPWRAATPEQRAALIEQFRILLLRTYSGALSKVTDHKVRMRPSRGQDGATDTVVRTQVVPSQGDAIDLDYRLEKTDAGWKIYDLNILGVWLVDNYKNEFSQTLSQSGIDGLVQTLTQKNKTLAGGGKHG